ncbi:Beta-amyrin synthase, partial [Dissostichus eleginoides]
SGLCTLPTDVCGAPPGQQQGLRPRAGTEGQSVCVSVDNDPAGQPPLTHFKHSAPSPSASFKMGVRCTESVTPGQSGTDTLILAVHPAGFVTSAPSQDSVQHVPAWPQLWLRSTVHFDWLGQNKDLAGGNPIRGHETLTFDPTCDTSGSVVPQVSVERANTFPAAVSDAVLWRVSAGVAKTLVTFVFVTR